MYQVEQHQIKSSNPWWDYCERVCFASKNLFNTAQFNNRQSLFWGYETLSQATMDKMFSRDSNYKALPAKVSQLVLKQVWAGLPLFDYRFSNYNYALQR